MADSDAKYSSECPDPVVEDAVKHAQEETESVQAYSWWGRFVTIAIIFVIVVGTFGAVIGTINTIEYRHQNSQLTSQSKCQTQLLKALSDEQKARTAISTDDRKAQAAYNKAISKAINKVEKQKAYVAYQKTLKANDVRRSHYPVPTFETDVCHTEKGRGAVGSAANNASKSTKHIAPSTSTTATKSKSVSSSTSGKPSSTPGPTPKAKSSSHVAAPAPPRATVEHTNTTTRVVIRAAPKPAPASNTPILKAVLPSTVCKINLLGVRLC